MSYKPSKKKSRLSASLNSHGVAAADATIFMSHDELDLIASLCCKLSNKAHERHPAITSHYDPQETQCLHKSCQHWQHQNIMSPDPHSSCPRFANPSSNAFKFKRLILKYDAVGNAGKFAWPDFHRVKKSCKKSAIHGHRCDQS